MKSTFLDSVKSAVKHWYVPLIVGVLFIILSIIVFTSPLSSLLVLSIYLALSFLFSGLSEIFFSISNRETLANWGWSLALGILTALVGFLLLTNPALSVSLIAFYVGFLLLFRSISSISFAFDLKKYGSDSWATLLIFGILGAIASFILIWNPIFAGLSVIILIAISLIFAGLFSIFLAIQLRRIHHSPRKITDKLRERYNDMIEEIREEWEERD